MMNLTKEIEESSEKLINAIRSRKNELISEVNETPSDQKNLLFKVDDALETMCRSFGYLYKSSVCLSNCNVYGQGLQRAVVDEANYIEIHLNDENGKSCDDSVPVSVYLVQDNTEVKTVAERIKCNCNIWTYRYFPLEPGPHKLHINIQDQPIQGSPYNLVATMPLRMRCIPKIVQKGFYKLGGLAIGQQGELAVVDSRGYQTIHLYNSNLDLVMSFADYGSGAGQCYYPYGITFDLAGNIIVADGSNNRIHKFDRCGKLIKTVGERGHGPLQFSRPTGIAINRQGHVYVCDRDNNRIQILKPDLTYDRSFGEYGNDPGNLSSPWDVAFDTQHNMYIVDAGHRCIKKFAPYGEFLEQIGPAMTDSEELKSPQMLCIDEYDYIFVTDFKRHQVIVFDTHGKYHTLFGENGSCKGQFNQPRGIAKAQDGTIFVADTGNCCLQVFH